MEEKGSGWRFFAGTVLGITGIMRFFDAIWAWRYHGAVPNNLEAGIFGHSLKTYGWVYFIVAVILIGSSFGVLSGSQVQPLDRHHRRRRPRRQRHLVDALLPGLVSALHRDRDPRHLRPGRIRRTGRGRPDPRGLGLPARPPARCSDGHVAGLMPARPGPRRAHKLTEPNGRPAGPVIRIQSSPSSKPISIERPAFSQSSIALSNSSFMSTSGQSCLR